MKTFDYILFALGILGMSGLVIVTCQDNMACSDACGKDPVDKCYEDRAFCAGIGNQYMVPVPSDSVQKSQK